MSDKLNKVTFNASLGVVSQETSTIERYNTLQNYWRPIAPYDATWIPYAIFQAFNNGNTVGIAAERLLMTQVDTTTIGGETYYEYECQFPAAVVGSVAANQIKTVVAFVEIGTSEDGGNLLGIELYDEDESGYNDTTYIAAQLLAEYTTASENDVVRVFNTDSDWVFNGTAWEDQDDYVVTNYVEHRSDMVTYALQGGVSTSQPTHVPTNTELIINELNKKALASDLTDDYYTKVDSEARYVNVTGDAMTGDLDMNSNKVTDVADGTVAGDAVNKGQLDLQVPRTRTIAGVDLQNDISTSEMKTALDIDDLEDDKVDKTTTIIGIDLQNSITLAEFKVALGEATTLLSGLMSATDKSRLDTLYALLDVDDTDEFIDTLGEVLEIFENYPEGVDIVTALNSKVDKVDGKGLSTNDYTDAEKAKVTNLPNNTTTELATKIDKNYSSYTTITPADLDTLIIYDASGEVLGKVTMGAVSSYVLSATGTFSPNMTADAETTGGTGFTAELSQRTNSTMIFELTKNADGQYYCDTGTNTLTTGAIYRFVMPTATETDDLTISVDASTGTYRDVFANGNAIPTNQTSEKEIALKWDGTDFITISTYYDNTSSNLNASNVQDAIDELASRDMIIEYGVRFNTVASSPTGERVKKVDGVLIVDGETNATGLSSTPAASIDGVGNNSFDNIFRVSLIEEFNINGDGNTFARFQPYFIKQELVTDGATTWEYYWACLTKLEGYRTPLSFLQSGLISYYDIGHEEGVVDANGRLRSITDGDFPTVSINRGAFRTAARKNDGDGANTDSKYQITDLAEYNDLIQIPMMIEFATKDLQSIFRGHVDSTYDADTVADGASVAGASTAIVSNADGANFVVGQGVYVSTDSKLHSITAIDADTPVAGQTTITLDGDAVAILTGANLDPRQWNTGNFKNAKYHSCYYSSSIATGRQPFMWRYIVNPYGNQWKFVDGIKIVDWQAWIATDPADYDDAASSGGEYAPPFIKLDYVNAEANGYSKELGFDARYPFAQFPIDTSGGSSTYYADYYYQNSGDRTALVGGSWNYTSIAGPFCWFLIYSLAYADGSIGARLSKRP